MCSVYIVLYTFHFKGEMCRETVGGAENGQEN